MPSRRLPRSSRAPLVAGALIVASAFALLTPPSAAGSSDAAMVQRIARFDASLDPSNRLSGVLRISRGDSLIVNECYGFANAELGVPNTPDTKFCIASITKEMTRLVAWQLLVERKTSLDAPLSSFIPEFPRGNEITVEHLMRFRAGFPHRVTTDAETCRPMTTEDVTRCVMRASLLVAPGTESVYSSATYSVLARVIELIEGKRFAEVLRERVFVPAGMHDTADVDGRTVLPRRAASYVPGLDGPLNAPLVDLSFLVGAGSVFSTAADLEGFFRAYRRGVFGEAAWSSLQKEGRVSWTGATNGFHAFVDYDPDPDVLVVFTGNSFGGGAAQLHDALPDLVAGRQPVARPRPAQAAAVPVSRLREYVGAYESRRGSTLQVGLRDGHLMLADSIVIPISETEFYFQNWSKSLTFVPGDRPGTWGIRNDLGDGKSEVWPRVD